MKYLAPVFTAIVLATIVIGTIIDSSPAQALDTPLANLRAYQISCPATALGIDLRKSTDLKAISSMMVWVNSTTPVYIGGGDVSSTLGMPICTDTSACPSSSVSIDAKGARCLSSSGTVTATVLVGTL
jgi:hypothetical protein